MSTVTRQTPVVIAHRGESSTAPEQTLAAFRRAVELGADMIEADVRSTMDGRLVMFHDATLERTTNGRGRLAAHTLAELQRLDAGSWFSRNYACERIPLLDELFDLAAESTIALCLEIKGESQTANASLARAVAREIEARGRLGVDMLASFDHGALAYAAQFVSGLRCAPDRVPERGPSDSRIVVSQAAALGARVVQHHHADLTVEVVRAVHEADIAIWAWPTNRATEIERVLEMGIDGVMGDDVGAIVEAVGRAA